MCVCLTRLVVVKTLPALLLRRASASSALNNPDCACVVAWEHRPVMNVALESKCARVITGRITHPSAPRGIAAGVPPRAMGALMNPALAMIDCRLRASN